MGQQEEDIGLLSPIKTHVCGLDLEYQKVTIIITMS